MAQSKKLDFVIVEHSLLRVFTFKEVIILKVIYIKAINRKLNDFPHTQNQIPVISGIAKNTLIDALVKFKDLRLIDIIDHKIYFHSDVFDEVLYNLDDEYRQEEEKYRDEVNRIPHIHFNFELCKKLNLNEIQYSVLHSYYILSKKSGYAFIAKHYFIRNFRIKERQFKNIKSKLIKDGYISKKHNSEMIIVNQTIIEMFKNSIIVKS